MSIAYVNGTTGGTTGTSFTLSYTSTAGNFLFLSLVSSVGIFSVIDSNSVTWTILNLGGGEGSVAYLLNSAAISHVSIVGNVSGVSAALGEYSNVGSVIGYTQNTGYSTSPWTVSRTLASSSNWLIAGGGVQTLSGSVITPSTGNLRNVGNSEAVSPYVWQAPLVDNTGSTSEICAATVTAFSTIIGLGTIGLEVAVEPDATVFPSGVTFVSAVHSPTISAGATVSPSGVTFASAVHSPTISAGVVVSPSGVTFASAVGTPTADVTANVTVSPAGVSASFAVGTPTISAGATVSPSGVTFASAVGTPVAFTTIILPPSGMQWGRGF